MKFGQQLDQRSKPEWSLYYINYKYLKTLIGEMGDDLRTGRSSKEEVEHKFTTAVELEMGKVDNFFLLIEKEVETELFFLKTYLNKSVRATFALLD